MSGGGGSKGGTTGDNSEKRWGDTTSKKGETSRVFVGNIDSYKTTCSDLRNKFSIYGQLIGIDVHGNGFAFVQFDNVDDAKEACDGETGTSLHGRRIEVRMFDKKNKNSGNNAGGGGGAKSGMGGGGFRDRSPLRNRHSGGGGMNSMNNNNNGPEPFLSGFHPQSQSNFSVPHMAICPPAPPGHHVPGGGPGAGNFGPGMNVPPPAGGMSHVEEQANEIEIIVINKDQWRYAEMIEQKIRQETGIRLIDILFLHAPQHIAMTLNDLFERRTLYALVVAPENELQKSVTIHVLHNQMEFRNLPLDKAMAVIAEDYRNNGPPLQAPLPPLRQDPGFNHRPDERNGSFSTAQTGFPSLTSQSAAAQQLQQQQQQHPLQPSSAPQHDKRLPDDISALLRITIQEGGAQFLSLTQIDTIIEFFTRERDRLTATQRPNISLNSYGISQTQQQALASAAGASAAGSAGGYLSAGPSALGQALGSDSLIGGSGGGKNINDLVNNPQVKQALNSLLNMGAIGSTQQQQQSSSSGHPYGDLGNSSTSSNDRQQFNAYGSSAVRRHPLTGVEVSRPPAGGQRGYGAGSAASRFQ